MRHHLEILEDIDRLLAGAGLDDERRQLEYEIRASATGGELCSRCGSKLLTLQNISREFSSIAGHLVKEFISCCHANGLYPKPNYEA
jgi:hypothetical protein